MSKNIIISAAGTGGHVFPGLAVAKYLVKQGYNVEWIGSNGMEYDLVCAQDINFHQINFSGVRGKGLLRILKLPFQMLQAIKQSKKILKDANPVLVLTMGGYISVPVGIAAKLLKLPLVIHEQNAVSGMANKLLNKISTKTLCGFAKALPNSIHTGNPTRENFSIEKNYDEQKDTLKILVIGGSLGANILNEIVPQALSIAQNSRVFSVVHQSGKKHIDTLINNYAKAKVKAFTVDFIDNMQEAYAWADIVICRSGAMTIAELCTIGVASILIPFPHAVDDHQTKNAQILVQSRAAWLIPQNHLNAQRLANILLKISHEKLRQMGLKAKLHSHQQATQKVAEICLEVAKNG